MSDSTGTVGFAERLGARPERAEDGSARMRFEARDEHLNQAHNLDQPFVLLFVPSLLLAVALGVGRRPLGATEALWGLALAAMALQSVRHIA